MSKYISKETEKKIIDDYLTGKYSYRELAEKYKFSDSTIWKILNRNGLSKGYRKDLRYSELLEDIDNGLSYGGLMEKYGLSYGSLNRKLRVLRDSCNDEKLLHRLMFELNLKKVGRSGYRGVIEKGERYYAIIWDRDESKKGKGRQICIGGYRSREDAFRDRVEWEMSVVRLVIGKRMIGESVKVLNK